MRRLLIALMLASLSGGCTTFNETHHFRTEDVQSQRPVNYYRLRVRGYSFFSSARYLSGYFDEAAVDQYFGEFSQPAKGTFPIAKQADQGTKALPIGSGDAVDENRRLVLLLSSNSDAIAEQLGAFAESNETLATLARLLNRDPLRRAARTKKVLESGKAQGERLKALADKVIPGLGQADTPDSVSAALVPLASRIALELGAEESFTTLEEASRWLDANRGTVLKE